MNKTDLAKNEKIQRLRVGIRAVENIVIDAIVSEETLPLFTRKRGKIEAFEKEIIKEKNLICKPIHQAHKAAVAFFKINLLDPAGAAKDIIIKKINHFHLIEKQKKEAAQAKLDAIAKEKEDAERIKANAFADKLEAQGLTFEAEEKREAARDLEIVPEVVTAPNLVTQTAAGETSTSFTITVEILDVWALIMAVAKGTFPHEILTVNETALKRAVKEMKLAPGFYGGFGIRVTEEARTRYTKRKVDI